MNMKITNLLFWVQENRLSEKFYAKLGFNIVESDDTHSTVSLNGFKIILVNMRDEETFSKDSMAPEKGRGMYVYLACYDVDTTYNSLKAKGIQPATEPKDWDWGNREFIVKDPDGYKLCFWSPITR